MRALRVAAAFVTAATVIVLGGTSRAQTGGTGGQWQVLPADWQGTSVVRKPELIDGQWQLVSSTFQWNGMRPQLLQLFVNPNAPATFRYHVGQSGVARLRLEWQGVEPPPSVLYVKVSSSSLYSWHSAVSTYGDAQNGLGDPINLIQGPHSESGRSTGFRLLKIDNPPRLVEIPITVLANTGGKGVIGDPGDFLVSLGANVEVDDRAAYIRAAVEPTYGRNEDGTALVRTRQANGMMIGDTAFTLGVRPGGTTLADYWAEFALTFDRQLAGAWHFGQTTLLNEWWSANPDGYWVDQLIGPGGHPVEYESVAVQDGYGYGWGRPLPSGPVTVDMRYKVTDDVDGREGHAVYKMLVHLPVEKVEELREYSGMLDLCTEFPNVAAAYRPVVIGYVHNTTGQPVTVNNFIVNRGVTATYGVTQGGSGGATLDVLALHLNFGLNRTVASTTQFQLNSSISVGPFTIPDGYALVVSAVPLGKVEEWLCSSWQTNGFGGDGTCLDVRENGPAFALRFEMKEIE